MDLIDNEVIIETAADLPPELPACQHLDRAEQVFQAVRNKIAMEVKMAEYKAIESAIPYGSIRHSLQSGH
jgi:hypothetical protein